MKKMHFKEKYLIETTKISKNNSKYRSIDEIITYLKNRIDEHPVATFIATFDHYAHTSSLPEHKIAEDIVDAKNIIFCFGKEIAVPIVVGVRPRSIGIVDLGDSFVLSFMEAPNPVANDTMTEWILGIKKDN